ncbi:MAG: ATP-grasp domain-containing protein [Myxococcales bacterium]|nr:ATP-grasp domain-containing protein [Myxococcales bacterium]
MSGFHRIFIANRGEVATRIARTCDRMGITPVFGISEADLAAPYLTGREYVVVGPSRASDSYLAPQRLVQAAKQTACSALHPGWGFLSERPQFAALCEAHGVSFIGPPPHIMHLMGQKTPAKGRMAEAGLHLIPGSEGIVESPQEALAVAEHIGYPVLIKAESGGGGRGMRIARSHEALLAAMNEAQAEASAAFGDPRIYLEKLIENGRHVEVQILSDKYGNAVHLGARDCSIQRNHQKLIEESPATIVPSAEMEATLTSATQAAINLGYVGAGTMEFLLDHDGTLKFMEMNTRLQVEHTVSEMLTGLDIVEEQIRIAAGQPLRIHADHLTWDGHAIECRINAEDPFNNFRPSPGVITQFTPPSGEGIRVDTHVATNYEVPPYYDSLIAKLIVRAPTRNQAINRMIEALEQCTIEGVITTIPLHLAVLRSETFRNNQQHSGVIPGFPPTS